jgi:hypothetical protein
MSTTFTKVAAGHYATADGRWAAVSDGYAKGQYAIDHEAVGGEWAACFDPNGGLRDSHQAGENLEWFPTKREAIAFLRDQATRCR